MPFIVGKVVAIAATAAISVTHGVSEHGEVESITPLMQEYVVPLIEENCFTVKNNQWQNETRCRQKKILILKSRQIGRNITYVKNGYRTTLEVLF